MEEKKLRRQNRIVLCLLAILVAIGLGIHQYFNYALQAVDQGDRTTVKVVIPNGATDNQVAKLLKKKGLVRSDYVFSYYLQTHKTNGVKAGQFSLRRSQTVPEIANQLQDSRSAKSR